MGNNKYYQVFEPENVHDFLLENTNINIGDIIEYIPNNQMGLVNYKVIDDGNNGKTLKVIETYDTLLNNNVGGKKKRKNKFKTRKNKKYITKKTKKHTRNIKTRKTNKRINKKY